MFAKRPLVWSANTQRLSEESKFRLILDQHISQEKLQIHSMPIDNTVQYKGPVVAFVVATKRG